VSRKYKGSLNGERYVANASPYKREVHDLDNENRNCMIDEIIRSRHDKPYRTLAEARRDDFPHCPFCCSAGRQLGGGNRFVEQSAGGDHFATELSLLGL